MTTTDNLHNHRFNVGLVGDSKAIRAACDALDSYAKVMEAQIRASLPWTFAGLDTESCCTEMFIVESESKDAHIAFVFEREHADFIIRACNAHDDLLTVCKQLLSRYDKSRGLEGASYWKDEPLIERARAAIAKGEPAQSNDGETT